MDYNATCSVEFTKEDKRGAVKAFSRVHGATVAFSIISVIVMYIAQFVTIALVGTDGLIALIDNPYYIWGLQVGCMYVIAFPLFLLMVRKLPSAQRVS